MEVIVKCTAAALVSCACSLLIKKGNPEYSFALCILVATIIVASAMTALKAAESLISYARDMLGASSTLIGPVLKCVGISFVSKFGSEFCKDASHSALASALELAGSACAAAVAMPLVISMMKMIGSML